MTDVKRQPGYNDILSMVTSNILPKIIIGEGERYVSEAFTSPSNMEIWMACYTDETYNPNPGKNYEILEKVGDAVLKLCFTDWVRNNVKGADQQSISDMAAKYLKTSELSKWLLYMNWMVPPGSDTPALRQNVFEFKDVDYGSGLMMKMREDLFEAIIGTIFTIGNKTPLVNLGYILCTRVMNSLFTLLWKGGEISQENLVTPKTQLKEICDGMGWGEISSPSITQKREGTNRYGEREFTVTFKIPAGKEVDNRKLGEPIVMGTATDKKKGRAEAIAIDKALEYLKETYDLTRDNVLKRKRDGMRARIAKLSPKASEKAYQNYMTLEFYTQTTDDYYFLQLRGIDEETSAIKVLHDVYLTKNNYEMWPVKSKNTDHTYELWGEMLDEYVKDK